MIQKNCYKLLKCYKYPHNVAKCTLYLKHSLKVSNNKAMGFTNYVPDLDQYYLNQISIHNQHFLQFY